jgi:hypothetical protein
MLGESTSKSTGLSNASVKQYYFTVNPSTKSTCLGSAFANRQHDFANFRNGQDIFFRESGKRLAKTDKSAISASLQILDTFWILKSILPHRPSLSGPSPQNPFNMLLFTILFSASALAYKIVPCLAMSGQPTRTPVAFYYKGAADLAAARAVRVESCARTSTSTVAPSATPTARAVTPPGCVCDSACGVLKSGDFECGTSVSPPWGMQSGAAGPTQAIVQIANATYPAFSGTQ